MGIWTYIFVIALGDVSAYDEIHGYVLMFDPWALEINSSHSSHVSACVAFDDRNILIASQTGRVFTGGVAQTWWGRPFNMILPRYAKRGRETFT